MREGLSATSSYFDVIEVCETFEKAQSVMGNSFHDLINNSDMGENLETEFDDYFCHAENEDGYYETLNIETREVI